MSDNNDISKHVDPSIDQKDSVGEPSTAADESSNGQLPNAEHPKGLTEPDEMVSQGKVTSDSEPLAEDLPAEPASKKPDHHEHPDAQGISKTGEESPSVTPTDEPKKEEVTSKEPKKPWEGIDFKVLDKSELVRIIEILVKEGDPILSEKVSRPLKHRYDEIHQIDREEALKLFVDEGNEADHFAYRFDELDNRFDGAYKLIRDRKYQHVKSLERDKEKNLTAKTNLLEELRQLVDEEETISSIDSIRKVQERWKAIGPVPGQQAKTLWANYHALMDRYYDQRSIYFELKELDRKRNLEAKLEICQRAENLVGQENLKQAISELNELHEEFKHVGPVPKSEQQSVWDRFKAASDNIYAKRKEFIRHLKKDLKQNLDKKMDLAREVQDFPNFTSSRITDWNKKTKDILELQKKWDAIGGLPREQAKEVNKMFWGSFKRFFHNKGLFFKELEGERVENLEKKKALVATAEALKDSTDWNETAEKLKQLQKEWRNVGPVPEKYRNSIYGQFKAACDTFFNNRRSQNHEIEKEYVENLGQKQKVCVEIESMVTARDFDLDKFLELKKKYDELGYVPAGEVKNIRDQFLSVSEQFLSAVPPELEEEATQIKYDIQFEKLKHGPNANRRIEQREQAIRREIGALENDIATWRNNLGFLASSKQADKVKQEFDAKIEQAGQKLEELKSQLRALRQL
jgi:hypothetical protein